MRGPGLRNTIDVRRLWRCPECNSTRRVPATEVSVRCTCRAERPLMQLVEGVRKVRAEHPPLPQYFEIDDLQPEETAAPVVATDNEDTVPMEPPAGISVVTTLAITVTDEPDSTTAEPEDVNLTGDTVIIEPANQSNERPPGDDDGRV